MPGLVIEEGGRHKGGATLLLTPAELLKLEGSYKFGKSGDSHSVHERTFSNFIFTD